MSAPEDDEVVAAVTPAEASRDYLIRPFNLAAMARVKLFRTAWVGGPLILLTPATARLLMGFRRAIEAEAERIASGRTIGYGLFPVPKHDARPRNRA
jgi:hypothetical protein